MAVIGKKGGIRLKLAWIVFLLAVALPIWFMAAALGYRFGVLDLGTALSKMTIAWGPMLVFVVGGLAALMLVLGLIWSPRVKTVILALVSLLIAGLCFGRIAAFGATAQSVPPIHDIQTDWSDPIQLSDELMAVRGEGSNPVRDDAVMPEAINARWPGIGGKTVAELQADAYPEVKSLIVAAPTDVVFSAVYTTLSDMGMEFVTENEAAGMIEATATTSWYGFKDDVAVRIRPQGEGSEIDVRSISRVGLSDLGANAKRVNAILESVSSQLRG